MRRAIVTGALVAAAVASGWFYWFADGRRAAFAEQAAESIASTKLTADLYEKHPTPEIAALMDDGKQFTDEVLAIAQRWRDRAILAQVCGPVCVLVAIVAFVTLRTPRTAE